MAPKLKALSGDDLVRILARFDFAIVNQKGSHIKMRRIVDGVKEILIIPRHNSISKGTLKAIFNQASAYISQSDLRPNFYN